MGITFLGYPLISLIFAKVSYFWMCIFNIFMGKRNKKLELLFILVSAKSWNTKWAKILIFALHYTSLGHKNSGYWMQVKGEE